MAEVFKAKSYGVEGFEKVVVLKRILPELAQNQSFVDMFLHEARLSVALSHANIVQVFDLGREEDTYFIAMEYVLGADLAQSLRRCRRDGREVPVEVAVLIACEVARALDYAHRRKDARGRNLGIVHRDISPQNILLSREGEVKVTDFGIAKAASTVEAGGTVRGKYAYMPPEQARGEEVDARADIYSLGVTLFEMLAGENPFAPSTAFAPDPKQVLERVIEGRATPLRSVRPEVPDELLRVVETSMAPDPADRYTNAAKVYEELTAFLYTLGRRVGANDLAEWLRSTQDEPAAAVDFKKIRDAFVDPDEDVELLEVDDDEPATARPPLRSHAERRDVTVLSLHATRSRGGAVPERVLDGAATLATRRGGRELSRAPGRVRFLFGVDAPDGRDTETAAAVSLRIIAEAPEGMVFGAGFTSARIEVDGDGRPVSDDRLEESIAAADQLAEAVPGAALGDSTTEGVLGERFEILSLGHLDALQLVGRKDPGRQRVVGRRVEFRRFGELLATAANQGLLTVTVVGEAGIGKTRYLEEVQYRLRRMNHPVTWYGATCLSYGREVPLQGLQGMLRALLGIEDGDSEAIMREKARRVRELGLTPEEMLAVGVVLGIVSATMESLESASRPLRTALQKIVTRLSEDRITVFCWDGAEHLDDLSATLLADVIEGASRAHALVVTARRPGRAFSWESAPNAEHVLLEPMSEDELRQLLGLTLNSDLPVPVDLVDDLAARSGANPFAFVELVKALREAGALSVTAEGVVYRHDRVPAELPRTLRGLTASRVARLPPAERRVLQVASVIGPRLATEQLLGAAEMPEALVEEVLSSLVAQDLLERTGQREYRFRSELLCEVLYDGLPEEVRRRLHATVAAVTEQFLPDRVDEFAERLASHYDIAGDRAKAVDCWMRAARRQLREHAPDASVQSFARAIDLALAGSEPDPKLVLSLYIALGDASLAARSTDLAFERLKLGIAFAEERNERTAVARLVLVQGRLFARRQQVVEAIRHLERALALAELSGDKAIRAMVVSALGSMHADRGEFGRAQRYLQDAARMASELGLATEQLRALASSARCQAASGDSAAARASLTEIDALCEQDSVDRRLLVEVARTRAEVLLRLRDLGPAVAAAQAAVDLAREVDRALGLCAASMVLGEAEWRNGDAPRGYAAFTEARGIAVARGYVRLAARADGYLAFLEASREGADRDAPRTRLEQALLTLDAQGFPADGIEARWLLGHLALTEGQPDKARRYLREALTKAGTTDNRVLLEECEAALREVRSSSIRPA
ncbi:MAG: protein kinase [Deltaproteobacteria bacterium]|nr:protein kinase [Deltaproteobacteria bacterium]